MKRKWILAGLLIVSFACTVQAETVDMGGFQIQVGEKQEGKPFETYRNGEEQKQEKETAERREEQITETPGPSNATSQTGSLQGKERLPTETYEVQQPAEGLEIDVQGQEQVDSVQEPEESFTHDEESIEIVQQPETVTEEVVILEPEAAQQSEEFSEKNGQESIQVQEADISTENIQQPGHESSKEENLEKKAEEHQSVVLLPGKDTRLGKGMVPFVQVKGEQEVCVLSCTVNHRECSYRWEGNCLAPVEPPLRKGVNCLEVSLLLKGGEIVSMEPWYFSCGVGSAML